MTEAISRNAPCPCGSGKKYKQCCGNLAASETTNLAHAAPIGLDIAALKRAAAELQGQGQSAAAEKLFQQILTLARDDFDALHMLGVMAAQRGQSREALRLILAAARQDDGTYAPVYENLARSIYQASQLHGGFERLVYPGLMGTDLPQYLFADELPALTAGQPRVSIVIPCYNHERYVEEALRSVFAQTYPNIEVIVIDDGSRDGTVEKIEQLLPESPFPLHFIARENRGAHITINEGIGMAQGKYVGILNSDDRYTPFRVDALVRMLVATGKPWGFAGVHFLDESGNRLAYGQDARVDELMRSLDRLYSGRPASIAFGRFNYAISTGNFFFTKTLWQQLNGFRDYRYVHDWDFCLRALTYGSPAILYEPAYGYRLHGANTIKESTERGQAETRRMFQEWGREIGNVATIDPGRAELLRCAWELAMLKTDQGHEIGREHLLEIGQAVLDAISPIR